MAEGADTARSYSVVVDPDRLLALFDDLVAEVVRQLDELADWGLSGRRDTQYRHDVVADEIIVPGLRAAGLGVLSEESGLVGEGGVTVVVDPVDGSTNASRGLPWYAASLCAVDEAGPLAALVVNLGTGVRYRAIRGRGARVDRSAGSVGSGQGSDREAGVVGFEDGSVVAPSGCALLGDAIVGVSGLPRARGPWQQYRALGAAALDLCAVADGTLDGYLDVDRAHGVWDYLGALLVCREAGVDVVDWCGEELVVLDPEARRGPVAGATAELTGDLVALARSWA